MKRKEYKAAQIARGSIMISITRYGMPTKMKKEISRLGDLEMFESNYLLIMGLSE